MSAAIEHEPSAQAHFTGVRFEHKEYDTTNYCEKFCPPGSILTLCTHHQRLDLEPEEAVLVTTNCCSTVNQRRPYGELGSVDKLTCFGCCAYFMYGPNAVAPQCCCAGDLVEEIVTELKARMKARGDTGQIKRAEQLMGEVQILKAATQTLDEKLDLVLKHLAISVPPPVAVTSEPL